MFRKVKNGRYTITMIWGFNGRAVTRALGSWHVLLLPGCRFPVCVSHGSWFHFLYKFSAAANAQTYLGSYTYNSSHIVTSLEAKTSTMIARAVLPASQSRNHISWKVWHFKISSNFLVNLCHRELVVHYQDHYLFWAWVNLVTKWNCKGQFLTLEAFGLCINSCCNPKCRQGSAQNSLASNWHQDIYQGKSNRIFSIHKALFQDPILLNMFSFIIIFFSIKVKIIIFQDI